MPAPTCTILVPLIDQGQSAQTTDVVRVWPANGPQLRTVDGAVVVWTRQAYAADASTGVATLTLPQGSYFDPPAQFVIQLPGPNGGKFSGVVPSVAGPLTLEALKNSYGWGLVQGSGAPSIQTIQTPPAIADTAANLANYAAAAYVGYLYWATDTNAYYRSNGTSWTPATVLDGAISTAKLAVGAVVDAAVAANAGIAGSKIAAATVTSYGTQKQRFYNALEHGINGDGTDEGTAINAFLALVRNATAYFPSVHTDGSAAIYGTSQRLVPGATNQIIRGDGLGTQLTWVGVAQVVAGAVTITAGGAGYSSTPTVTFSAPTGPNPLPATGTATVVGGVITGITVTNIGRGYLPAAPPTVTITDTSGSGATATVAAVQESMLESSSMGNVRLCDILLQGPTAVAPGTRIALTGLHLGNSFSWTLDNVMIRYFNQGILWDSGNPVANPSGDSHFFNTRIYNCDVGVVPNSATNYFVSGAISGCTYGVQPSAPGGAIAIGMVTMSGGGTNYMQVGIDWAQPNGGPVFMQGGWIETAQVAGVRNGNGASAGSNHFTIRNVEISAPGSFYGAATLTAATDGSGVLVAGTPYHVRIAQIAGGVEGTAGYNEYTVTPTGGQNAFDVALPALQAGYDTFKVYVGTTSNVYTGTYTTTGTSVRVLDAAHNAPGVQPTIPVGADLRNGGLNSQLESIQFTSYTAQTAVRIASGHFGVNLKDIKTLQPPPNVVTVADASNAARWERGNTLLSTGPNSVVHRVQADPNQQGTAYLSQWVDATGATLAGVGQNGRLEVPNITPVGNPSTTPYISFASSNSISFLARAVGNVPLAVQGMNGQTGDLLIARDYLGNSLIRITAAGLLTAANGGALDATKLSGMAPTSGFTVPYQALPVAGATVGVVKADGTTITNTGGTLSAVNNGTVTSVALSVPGDLYTVSGSPVTGAGTLALAKITNAAQNAVLAGPASGGPGSWSLRTLVAADIPSLDAAQTTTGVFAIARMPTGTSGTTVALGNDSRITGAVQSSLVTAAGDMLYASGSGTVARLPAGTTSQVLVGGATPGFGAVPLAALVGITTSQLSATAGIVAGQLAVASPTAGQVGGLTTANLSATAGITSGQIASVAASVLTGSNSLPDSVLSANVPLLNAATTNVYTGTRTSYTAAPAAQTSHALLQYGDGGFAGGATGFSGASLGTIHGINMSSATVTTPTNFGFADYQVDGISKWRVLGDGTLALGIIKPSSLTGAGTVPLAALAGITTTQLAAGAGIVAAQIASVNPSALTGTGTVPSAGLPTATSGAQGAVLISTGSTDTSGAHVVLANDTRLSDTRTPKTHGSTHAPYGSDPTYLDRGNQSPNRIENIDRSAISTSAITGLTSGVLYLMFTTASVAPALTKFQMRTSSTIAAYGASPGCYLGLYSVPVDANGAINGNPTLVAATADVHATFAASASALQTGTITLNGAGGTIASYTPAVGTRYALGFLFVNATTMPTFVGAGGNSDLYSMVPVMTGTYGSGLTALPATLTAASIGTTGLNPYICATA